VIVNKEDNKNDDLDEEKELFEEEREAKLEKMKSLKRRGEKLTEEEKKARKEVLKDIKNERKQKKQKFKKKFDEKVKGVDHKIKSHNKDENLQGVSVVKIN